MALQTTGAENCGKGDVLGLPYGPECIHEPKAKLDNQLSGEVTKLIKALQRDRVLLRGHLGKVGCVAEKVTQDIHREVIKIKIDLGELRALAEGR